MKRETASAATAIAGRRWPSFLLAACALLLCGALAGEALAQLSTGRARTRGRIEDPQGNPVPGAKITLTHVRTGDVYTTEADDDGVWVKGNMGSGEWKFEINAPGFQTWTRTVNVRNLMRNAVVEAVMQPGSSEPEAEGPTVSSLFSGELGERLKAANALFDAGEHAAALAAFEDILAEEAAKEEPNPEIYYVHLNAGNAAYRMEEYAKAADHYGAMLEEAPDNQDARLGLAKVYMMERRVDDALAELDKLDLSGIQDPIVYYNIGSLLFDQGQSAEAEGYYQQAVDLDPSFVEARMQLGLSMIQQGKMAEAKPHFEKVVELAPGTQDAALAQEFLGMIEG